MRSERPVVLYVDRDEPDHRALAARLTAHGYEVVFVHDGEAAFHALDETRVDCLVTELKVHRIDGMAVLARARALHPEVCAVLIAAGGDIATATEAMRQGAADFQVKPLNVDKLLAVLAQGRSRQALAQRTAELESRLDERLGFERFTGHSPAVTRLVDQARQVAATPASVLVLGEPGTGKALLAQAIHQNSPRARERYVRVPAAALAEEAVEHEFARADGGTLFLDEIGEIAPSAQGKLLGALAAHDVRVLAATERNLEDLVATGRFRPELHERLRTVTLRVPALRERAEDVPLLVEQFLREFNREYGRRVTGITRGAMQQLSTYHWPGNVRELRNAVEGMVVFADGRRPLDVSDLPQDLQNARRADAGAVTLPVGVTMAEVEKRFIEETLRAVRYDKPRAAEMLGMGLRTLYRKLKEYEIG